LIKDFVAMKKNSSIGKPKRDAILDAASALFLRHGYALTTMDEVARLAGVTKQTVYAHHQSKELLFTHMLAALCSSDMPSQMQLDNANTPFETLLTKVGLAVLNMITRPEALGATRLVIAESAHYPELAELYYTSGTKRLVGLLTDFIASQKKRKVISVKDPASAASYFLAMLKGQYYVRMMLRVKPVPTKKQKEAHVREVVRIFMHLYGAKNPIKTSSVL
jgi:TetR/AcrR family transcriptional regulator, mexJK operon transcriptional repressor